MDISCDLKDNIQSGEFRPNVCMLFQERYLRVV